MSNKRKQKRDATANAITELVAKMSLAAIEQGHVPLFLVSGKEIGGGYRDYSLALASDAIDREYVLYVIGRLQKLLDGSVSKEIEGN